MYVSMLLGSPLLPTDHRDSPQTLTTTVSPVNTFTTRCRGPLERAGRPSPICRAEADWTYYIRGSNVIVPNISLGLARRWGVFLAAPLQEPQSLGPVLRPAEYEDAGRDQHHSHAQQDRDGAELGRHAGAIEEAVADASQGVSERRDRSRQLHRQRQHRERVVDARAQEQETLKGYRHLLALLGREEGENGGEDAQSDQRHRRRSEHRESRRNVRV